MPGPGLTGYSGACSDGASSARLDSPVNSSASSLQLAQQQLLQPEGSPDENRVSTFHLARPHLPHPLGEREVPEDEQPPMYTDLQGADLLLSEEQVKTCACVLLSPLLGPDAVTCVWPTTYTHLEMLGQDVLPDERRELREWLRRRPTMTVYVAASVSHSGRRSPHGGHHVGLAVRLSPAGCCVDVYDSSPNPQQRWHCLRTVAHDTALMVLSIKDTDGPPDQAVQTTLVHVPDEEQQKGPFCGFHVALFIAQDGARGHAPAGRLLPLRNCPEDVALLRRWLADHVGAGAFEPSGSWGPGRDTAKEEAAFAQLEAWVAERQAALRRRRRMELLWRALRVVFAVLALALIVLLVCWGSSGYPPRLASLRGS